MADPNCPVSRVLARFGLLQKELAARGGLSQPLVARLCSGKLRVSQDMAARICDAVDPERQVLDERHLLYPDRYPDFKSAPRVQETGAGVVHLPEHVG